MQMVGVSTVVSSQSFYVQRQVFRQHYERFSKIFRKSKVLRHFRNYFANPNHPEFWEQFRTFGIIGKFSEPIRDFGFFYTWRAI